MFQIIIGIPNPYLEDSPDFSQKLIAELVLGKSIGKENEIRVCIEFQELCRGFDELMSVEFLVITFGEIKCGGQSKGFQKDCEIGIRFPKYLINVDDLSSLKWNPCHSFKIAGSRSMSTNPLGIFEIRQFRMPLKNLSSINALHLICQRSSEYVIWNFE